MKRLKVEEFNDAVLILTFKNKIFSDQVIKNTRLKIQKKTSEITSVGI